MQPPTTPPQPEYLTDADLAAMLAVTTRTTKRWRASGDGPVFTRAGVRRIIYKRSHVEAWLAARSYQHRAAEAVGKTA